MGITHTEGRAAQFYSSQIRELAEKFARVKGGPMTLALMDERFIRDVHIDPVAIVMGNLRVDVRLQPIAPKSEFRVSRIYDLTQPPIAANDVAELKTLAELLGRLGPSFSENE